MQSESESIQRNSTVQSTSTKKSANQPSRMVTCAGLSRLHMNIVPEYVRHFVYGTLAEEDKNGVLCQGLL